MRKLIFILMLFLFNSLISQSITKYGIITKNETWNYDTVYLGSNITIDSNVTLKIAPGTKIVSKGYFSMNVFGNLLAIGTPTKMIKFTVIDTTNFSDSLMVDGSWKGIEFLNSNKDSSIINYCEIAYCKENLDYTVKWTSDTVKSGGAISIINSSNIRIYNCNIHHHKVMQHGGGIFVSYSNFIKISKNKISENFGYEGAGIAEIESDNVIIDNNLIINNLAIHQFPGSFFYGGTGGGIEVQNNFLNKIAYVFNNLIANNASINAALYNSSFKNRIVGNIVVNNLATGIMLGNSIDESIIANNTVSNNSYGSGIVLSGSSNTKIINCIVRNNKNIRNSMFPNIHNPRGNFPSSYFNNIENIPMNFGGKSNIDKPTLFVRPTIAIGRLENGWEADWRLQKGSPEIDAGTLDYGVAGVIDSIDIYGTKRIIGSAIDIGAAEYNPITVIPEPYTSDKIKVYPNPFADHFWLQSEDITLDADYSIYNITGQLLFSYPIKGNDTKLIELNAYTSGTYLLRIVEKTGNVLYASKVIKQ